MKVETVKFDFGSPYSTPANMIATLAEHQDRADALIGKVAERMNKELLMYRTLSGKRINNTV
ncbi:hypothetical protein [Aeromonas caviae]